MGCSGSRPALLVAPPTGACELEMKASSMISNDVYLVDTSGPRSAAKCLNLTHKPVEEETGNYVTAMTSTLDKSTLMVSATEIAAWDYRLSDALAAAKDWGGYDESLSPERVAELDQSYGVGKMTHYWWQMAVVTKIYKDVTMQQQLAQLTARVRGESLSESSMLTSSEGGGARVHTSQLTGLKYTLQVHGKDVPLEFKGMLNVHVRRSLSLPVAHAPKPLLCSAFAGQSMRVLHACVGHGVGHSAMRENASIRGRGRHTSYLLCCCTYCRGAELQRARRRHVVGGHVYLQRHLEERLYRLLEYSRQEISQDESRCRGRGSCARHLPRCGTPQGGLSRSSGALRRAQD